MIGEPAKASWVGWVHVEARGGEQGRGAGMSAHACTEQGVRLGMQLAGADAGAGWLPAPLWCADPFDSHRCSSASTCPVCPPALTSALPQHAPICAAPVLTAATSVATVPALGLGMRPRGPSTRPSCKRQRRGRSEGRCNVDRWGERAGEQHATGDGCACNRAVHTPRQAFHMPPTRLGSAPKKQRAGTGRSSASLGITKQAGRQAAARGAQAGEGEARGAPLPAWASCRGWPPACQSPSCPRQSTQSGPRHPQSRRPPPAPASRSRPGTPQPRAGSCLHRGGGVAWGGWGGWTCAGRATRTSGHATPHAWVSLRCAAQRRQSSTRLRLRPAASRLCTPPSDGHPRPRTGALGQRHGGAQLLVGVLWVDVELGVHLHRLRKLGRRSVQHQLDGLERRQRGLLAGHLGQLGGKAAGGAAAARRRGGGRRRRRVQSRRLERRDVHSCCRGHRQGLAALLPQHAQGLLQLHGRGLQGRRQAGEVVGCAARGGGEAGGGVDATSGASCERRRWAGRSLPRSTRRLTCGARTVGRCTPCIAAGAAHATAADAIVCCAVTEDNVWGGSSDRAWWERSHPCVACKCMPCAAGLLTSHLVAAAFATP